MHSSNLRRYARPFVIWSSVITVVCVANASPGMDRVREFISEGAFLIDVRPRYEMVDQTGFETAHAATLRTRLGYLSRVWHGLSALFEAENVASPFPNEYNQSQLNPGGSDKAIVTDPTGTNVSQAWLDYVYRNTSVRVGRQRLNLDNGRFIGDYSWRQHLQTIDGVVLTDNSFKDLTLTYGYITRVNRIYGPDHVQGVYQSDSHVFHGAWRGLPFGTLSAYAYLLDFEGAARGNSNATYGLSFDGETTVFERLKLGYRAEYARQTDYGSSPLFYETDYVMLDGRATFAGVTAGVGYELPNADNNFALRTPLGSLHDFNGWADAFTTTPTQGLRDTWMYLSGTLPWWDIGLSGAYHRFDSYNNTRLGTEIDLAASYNITPSLGAAVKYASFKRDVTTMDDIRKIWVQVELKY